MEEKPKPKIQASSKILSVIKSNNELLSKYENTPGKNSQQSIQEQSAKI